MILSILSAVFSEAVRLFFEMTYRYPGSLVPKVLMVITVLGCLGIGRFGYLLFKFSTPQKRMRQIRSGGGPQPWKSLENWKIRSTAGWKQNPCRGR